MRTILKLEPWLKTVVWGSDRLQLGYGKVMDVTQPLGETWEVSAVPGHESRILGSPDTIATLAERYPDEFGAGVNGSFPLLVKLLAPSQWLSVQVHPDDAQARELSGEAFGKHEAWMILDAEPDAEILVGLEDGVTKAQFGAALDSGDEARILKCMRRIRVSPGDLLDIRPGTVHALGPGMTLIEVQQPSDLTYRLYDWNRRDLTGQPRDLHLQKGLKVLREDSRPAVLHAPEPVARSQRSTLIENSCFRFEIWHAEGSLTVPLDDLAAIVCIAGRGAVVPMDGGAALPLEKGQSCLVPRGLGSLRVEGRGFRLAAALPPL